MIKYLKDFFYPPVLTFAYNQPKEIVIDKIREVLSKKVTFFSSRDMTGMFLTENMFTISLVVPVLAAKALDGFYISWRCFRVAKRCDRNKNKTKARRRFVLSIFYGSYYRYR